MSLGVLAVLAAAAAVYTTRAVLIRVLIALFVAISLDPAVRMLTRRGVRRGLAVLLIFLAAAGLVAAFLVSVIPAMVDQFQSLLHDFPGYLARLQDRSARFRALSDRFHLTSQVQSLIASLPGRLGSGLLGITRRLFGALFLTLTVVVLAIYFMADLPRLRNGVPFAVPLALAVALFDLIPMIGATLGAVAGVLVTVLATELWPDTVIVAVFFVAYQQLENYLIAPCILRSTVSLSAAAVLLAAGLKVVLAERLRARDAADAQPPVG